MRLHLWGSTGSNIECAAREQRAARLAVALVLLVVVADIDHCATADVTAVVGGLVGSSAGRGGSRESLG